jgi:hypothetical protein
MTDPTAPALPSGPYEPLPEATWRRLKAAPNLALISPTWTAPRLMARGSGNRPRTARRKLSHWLSGPSV